MLDNNNGWKEIDEFVQNEKETMINKYGIDICENFNEKTSKKAFHKRLIRKRIIILVTILLIIFLFTICWGNLCQSKYKKARISSIENVYNINVEEKPINVNFNGNGFIIYSVEEIPGLEIHALSKDDYTFINDLESRIYKYFFEKWTNNDKDKFIVEESYEDYTYNFTTKKDWILHYRTYIKVSNYNEMLNATEIIINFRNYMPFSDILIESYIEFNNKTILPHNASIQTDDEIRASAKEQYAKIIQGT